MSAQKNSLSILIPNYNWPVAELITTLHQQCLAADISFEILCFDDAQEIDFAPANNVVNELSHVLYQVNPKTRGRSQNRNALAKKAQFDLFLFLDGDAKIEKPDFIAQYMQNAQLDSVLCGGTAYFNRPPKNAAHLLRYWYGKKREERKAQERQEEPWKGFSAFNFLIPSALFFALQFDEKLTQYGHEDTLFGKELKLRGIPIHHIENAAVHLGLDEAEVFLQKTRKSVENVRSLIDQKLINEDIKLYAWYMRVNHVKGASFLGFLFKRLHKRWEKQLSGGHPNLALFDFYKLCYLCSLPKNKHKAPLEQSTLSE